MFHVAQNSHFIGEKMEMADVKWLAPSHTTSK